MGIYVKKAGCRRNAAENATENAAENAAVHEDG